MTELLQWVSGQEC